MPRAQSEKTAAGRPAKVYAEGMPDATMEAITALYGKWILPYSWRVALVILGVLLAVAAVKVLGARQADRSGAGFAALSRAEDTDALLAVARDYDGTPVAARAQLEAARRLFDEGKYEQAGAKFSLAAKAAQGNEALRLAATLGEAYATEANGKPELAEKTFADTATGAKSKAIALDAWLGASRCAKAQGKLAEAEKYCTRAGEAATDNPIGRRRVDEAKAAVSAARFAKPATEAAAAPEAAPAAVPAMAPAP